MADTPSSPDKGSSAGKPQASGLGKFWQELRRRKVVRVAITYAIVGWLIIQVANATFGEFGIPLWAYRFVVLMVVLGFPLAIILAWAFELTPEGIKTTKSAQAAQGNVELSEKQQKKRNWLAYATGAIIPTLIFGVLAAVFYFQARSSDSELSALNSSLLATDAVEYERSIAVLPFTNMSANQEHAYFADGVHETILTDLANLRELRVISRTSVMQYRDTTKTMPEIGKELGVAFILEGSMQRAENEFRLTAQLIDARSDEHVWADNFDGELTHIFSVQSELAKTVAEKLQAVLSPQEERQLSRSKSSSIEAYDLYLQALEEENQRSFSGRRAINLLEQAVDLDPTFTDAWLFIAERYGNAYIQGREREPERLREIKRAIEVAVRLEPDNPNVKVGLGVYFYQCHLDYSRARSHIEPVVEFLPNHIGALSALGEISEREGQFVESISHFEKAHLLDPKSASHLTDLRRLYRNHRNWDATAEVADKIVAIRAGEAFNQYARARIEYLDRGSVKEANQLFADLDITGRIEGHYYSWLYDTGDLRAFQEQGFIDSWEENGTLRSMGGGTWRGTMQMLVLSLSSETEYAKKVLDFVIENVEQRNSGIMQARLGLAYAVAGEYEKAQAALDNALAMRPELSDFRVGVEIAYTRAIALGWMGEKDAAVAELKRLSKKPNDLTSYFLLKNSLHFYPLRDHPGFQQLLEDPALKQPLLIKNW